MCNTIYMQQFASFQVKLNLVQNTDQSFGLKNATNRETSISSKKFTTKNLPPGSEFNKNSNRTEIK